MHYRSALKFIGITNLLALLVTALAAYFLGRTTTIQLADTGSVIAMVICALGALMARGARLGDGPVSHQMTASVADSPNSLRGADYDDMLAGVSYGALLIVAGLLWLGVVVGMYQLLA
ncbi:hypothetical protein FNU76_14030 [Chitinimonas arctica]|uniref:Uncharacterized protein n=1 Tax=Chitinimonas arctica TaxID=2594795 RepID=A0A516SGU7_9NEIS|nr:hypothetical protein [Chitinimonas arctica]QDQ27386.1 hypothetical protein FNU76_14030 [Chitinimonas arctica]